MMDTVIELANCGSGLGMRIPADIARVARLKANQQVRLSVEEGRLMVTPLSPKTLTLAERLQRFDRAVHGGEAMAAGNVQLRRKRVHHAFGIQA